MPKTVCTENYDGKYIDFEDGWYHKCVTTLHQIFLQALPLVQLSKQWIKDKPWVNKSLKIGNKHKNQLYKSQPLCPGQQQLVKYNMYKNLLCISLKGAETNYYQDVFDSTENFVYNKWKTLNPLINPKTGPKRLF